MTDGLLDGMLKLVRPAPDGIEFAVVAMGRYGGAELGIGSDADVLYVYRALSASVEEAAPRRRKSWVPSPGSPRMSVYRWSWT